MIDIVGAVEIYRPFLLPVCFDCIIHTRNFLFIPNKPPQFYSSHKTTKTPHNHPQPPNTSDYQPLLPSLVTPYFFRFTLFIVLFKFFFFIVLS